MRKMANDKLGETLSGEAVPSASLHHTYTRQLTVAENELVGGQSGKATALSAGYTDR